MPLLVKICGLKTLDALDAALDSGADMVGFVFFPPSPRNISLEAARALGLRVKDRAKTVALVVDADDALLEQIIGALKPDTLQLHGHETPQRVAAIRESFGVPVMKVLAIETKADLAAIAPYAGVADRLLFDALPPRDATRPGGLGKPFDWTLLKGIAMSTLLGVGTQATFGNSNSDLVQAIRQSTQESANQAGQKIVERDLNIQPTITVRPGWTLRIILSKDIMLEPYKG